ncbi:MAG: hypothetical protein LBD58_07660 [Treponema sp.]|nr:hypothetical protein [Treponema sp.]
MPDVVSAAYRRYGGTGEISGESDRTALCDVWGFPAYWVMSSIWRTPGASSGVWTTTREGWFSTK